MIKGKYRNGLLNYAVKHLQKVICTAVTVKFAFLMHFHSF